MSADADCSVRTWLDSTQYTQLRKDELFEIAMESEGLITFNNLYKILPSGKKILNRYVRNNSFIKDEPYPTYKPARFINSRTDEFKVRTGPIFKLIEKELFALPYFIKHTPVDERAEEIKLRLFQDGAHVVGTDYTAYESCFTKEFMEACEFQLYEYMTQDIEDTEWINIVKTVLGGENVCRFRNKFTVTVDATRMSGEMCTSLGNSFANLMAMKFIAEENKLVNVKGRVEGDDGIFTFYGPVPTPQDFADIGMIIKMEEYDNLTEGSFCGIMADENEMINISDPIKAMLNFGWTTREYRNSSDKKKMELLRAKALSMAYQYAGCPILYKLADYALRITEGYHYYLNPNSNAMDGWHRQKLLDLMKKNNNKIPRREPGMATRMLMEKKFGVTVGDQIEIERYLDNKTDLSPLDHPAILSNCNSDSIDYYNRYVFSFPIGYRLDETECPIYDSYSQDKLINNSFSKYEFEARKKRKDCPKQGEKTTYRKAGQGSETAGYYCPPQETD